MRAIALRARKHASDARVADADGAPYQLLLLRTPATPNCSPLWSVLVVQPRSRGASLVVRAESLILADELGQLESTGAMSCLSEADPPFAATMIKWDHENRSISSYNSAAACDIVSGT
eukprot:IDg18082t1